MPRKDGRMLIARQTRTAKQVERENSDVVERHKIESEKFRGTRRSAALKIASKTIV